MKIREFENVLRFNLSHAYNKLNFMKAEGTTLSHDANISQGFGMILFTVQYLVS
jgi:hypothetical protein